MTFTQQLPNHYFSRKHCFEIVLPQHHDVLAVDTSGLELAVELERKILVEEKPQETSRTAGGAWPARWAAYWSAART